jgi:hypothetical protein
MPNLLLCEKHVLCLGSKVGTRLLEEGQGKPFPVPTGMLYPEPPCLGE